MLRPEGCTLTAQTPSTVIDAVSYVIFRCLIIQDRRGNHFAYSMFCKLVAFVTGLCRNQRKQPGQC